MVEDPARYERRDFHPRILAWAALGLVLLCVLASVFIFFFEKRLDRFFGYHGKATWTSSPEQQVPEPRLQVNSAQELQAMRAQEETVLQSYGWVDREHGVTRIPIEKAMQLLVQRGLPVRPSTPTPKP